MQHSSALVAGNLDGQAASEMNCSELTSTNPSAVRRSISIGNDHDEMLEESTIILQNQQQQNVQPQLTEHTSAELSDSDIEPATVDSSLDSYTLPKKSHSSSVTTGM